MRLPPTFMPATPSSQPRITSPAAELEVERLAAVLRAVELVAAAAGLARVVQPAGVVDADTGPVRASSPDPRPCRLSATEICCTGYWSALGKFVD